MALLDMLHSPSADSYLPSFIFPTVFWPAECDSSFFEAGQRREASGTHSMLDFQRTTSTELERASQHDLRSARPYSRVKALDHQSNSLGIDSWYKYLPILLREQSKKMNKMYASDL